MKSPALLALSSLLLATSALAQKATIAGSAVGVDGRPLKNVQIRIQQENAKAAPVLAKTDATGRFTAAGLPEGTYNVTAVVNGAAASSPQRVKTGTSAAVRLNLAPAQKIAGVAPAAPAKKTRARWIYPTTGSHMGGFTREGAKGKEVGPNGQPIETMSGNDLGRIQTRATQSSAPGAR